ncbi:MAG TPA: EFR1 family ferrodoxin [Victivallales bacterium]|nr:EFR1 family ferrodoxin [Victivallales bacterium]
MKKSKMAIYCFSGTGNTLRIAQIYKNRLLELGIENEIILLPNETPREIGTDISIMFPVYAQCPPPFVFKWIESLPEGKGQKAVVISTYASMSGLVAAPLKKILKKKGFCPVVVREIKMPHNFISQRFSKSNAKIISDAEREIAKFAEEVVGGKSTTKTYIPMSGILRQIASFIFARIASFMGSKLYADKNLCSKCGLCSRLCPVGNITTKEGFPSWNHKCEQCLRCINFCPNSAVGTTFKMFAFIYYPKYICPRTDSSDLLRKSQ